MGVYLKCGKTAFTVVISDIVGMAFFFVKHRGVQEKHYTLITLPVHNAQIESSYFFVACFNCEL